MKSEYEFEKLEEALIRAGRDMVYPVTPPLAARVRASLEAKQSRRILHPWFAQPRFAWSLAIALLLAVALLIASPDARNAIAQWLGLRGLQIIVVTPTPTPTITPTLRPQETPRPTATPTSTSAPRTQCCETTLAEAQANARFKLLLPPNQTPSRVYLQNVFGTEYQQAILVFGDPSAPTFTLYEAHNVVYQKLVNVGKEVGPGTVIGEASVNGRRALWFTGAPHVLVYLSPSGEPVPEAERVVDANTLAWEDETRGVLYRLETKRSKEEAVRFAESLQ